MYSDEHSPKISINTSPAHGINISNSSEVKRLFDNMKKDTDLIVSAMDLTIKECTEKKMSLASQKEKITRITDLAKKYNQESIQYDAKLREHRDTISVMEHDMIQLRNTISGVTGLTSELQAGESDKIKRILDDSFIEKTKDLEKAVTELKSFKKTKDAHDEKMSSLQESLANMEVSFDEQTVKTTAFCSNTDRTIVHIAQKYFEVMSKANSMLQITLDMSPDTERLLSPTSQEKEEENIIPKPTAESLV